MEALDQTPQDNFISHDPRETLLALQEYAAQHGYVTDEDDL